MAGGGCSKRSGALSGPILPPPAAEWVTFAPDGKTLAASFETEVKVWDLSGAERTSFRAPNLVSALAFSHDGKTLAVGCADKSLKLWDATTGSEKRELTGHRSPLKAAAFSPDGKYLATAAGDTSPYAAQQGNVTCEVKLWDAAGTPLGNLQNPGSTIFRLAFSPDGQTLVTAGQHGKVKIWDPATRAEKATALDFCPENILCLTFSCDGKYLAAGCILGEIQVWETATWKAVDTPKVGHTTRINTVDFSPSGKRFAAACEDGMVKLWETAGWTEQWTFKGDAKMAFAAVFGADDSTLATCGKEGAVHLWDATKREERLTLR
jgi:WD40 repeat protein